MNNKIREHLKGGRLHDNRYYKGIAVLYRTVQGFKFKLIGDNGEKLVQGSEPYASKQARKKTLYKYFPNFKQVEK